MNNRVIPKTLSKRWRRFAGASTACLAFGASAAMAQDGAPSGAEPAEAASAAAADESEAAPENEIIVTASRVARDGYSAPTPTTIVGTEALESRGATNVATVLNELPAFRASTTPGTNSVRSIFPGAYYADLRGLGASRTLVLVDGNRFVPQITTGLGGYQVDLNQVPALMLDRAEVVTGGASAQWGSDAVAGVVNLILKKDFQGINAEAQYGISEQGDNEEFRIGLLAGTKLGERARVVFGIDYVDNKGVGDVWTRDWGQGGDYIIANPCPLAAAVSAACPAGGNGQARQLILPDVRFSTATPGGLIVSTTGPAAALKGIQFGANGSISTFSPGAYAGAQFMQGGGSNAGLNLTNGVFIAPASERLIGYGRFAYDFGESTEFYVEGSYARSQGKSQSLPPRNEQTSPITIRTDNPFIPTPLRTIINNYNASAAAGQQITSFNVGRYSQDIGAARSDVTNTTYRVVGGLQGKFGDSGWKWDGAMIFGRNDYNQKVANNRIRSKFNFATDVVANAAGVPVCRATLPGASFNAAAAGCVPFNIFGDGSATRDVASYVTGTLMSTTRYDQTAANLNVTGEPFHSWAGPVSLAAGVEWRHEKQITQVDPFAEAAEYETTNARSFRGGFSVKEAYLETVVPLAADMTFARSLDLNGAVRVADYSTAAGTQVTWKVGGTWKPVDDLLVRVARSRDIRAPNIFELRTPPVSTITNQSFTRGIDGGPAGQVSTQQLIGGNADLQPEKADTFTVGAVLTPSFVPGLSLSVDYYDITVKDAITALSNVVVVNGCNAADPFFCSFVSRLPAGSPATYLLNTPYVNLAMLQRTGLDFSATYRLDMQDVSQSLPGALTLQFAGNYATHYREDAAGAGYIERAGETSNTGTPRFQSTSTITYALHPAQLSLQMRTIGSGKYNKTFVEGVDINDNDVAGRTYFNLSGQVDLTDKFQLFGVVNNVTDRDPPIAPVNFSFPTINSFFDMVGRSYRVGIRYKM